MSLKREHISSPTAADKTSLLYKVRPPDLDQNYREVRGNEEQNIDRSRRAGMCFPSVLQTPCAPTPITAPLRAGKPNATQPNSCAATATAETGSRSSTQLVLSFPGDIHEKQRCSIPLPSPGTSVGWLLPCNGRSCSSQRTGT